MTDARRIVIWRHGQTNHNAAGIWQGQLDTELSPLGVTQAAAAAPALAALAPATLYSSDLQRAARTADPLAALTGLTPIYDERLREINVGTWAGRSAGEIAERYPEIQDAIARGEDPVRGETGESIAHVAVRAAAFAAELTESLQPGQTAVCASHGVTARTLTAVLAGIPQDIAWKSLAGLHNCHWSVLLESRSGWRLEKWNVAA